MANEINMEFIEKECVICHKMRTFAKGTPRDLKSICGNCWDWENEPASVLLTPEEAAKLKRLLATTT